MVNVMNDVIMIYKMDKTKMNDKMNEMNFGMCSEWDELWYIKWMRWKWLGKYVTRYHAVKANWERERERETERERPRERLRERPRERLRERPRERENRERERERVDLDQIHSFNTLSLNCETFISSDFVQLIRGGYTGGFKKLLFVGEGSS